MSLHKEIIWARGTSFNVSPRPELPLTSSVFYFVNYPRTLDILCFLFFLQYLPFISANGTSFNVSPRPELPLTSNVFYFVNYPRTQDMLCFLCCLQYVPFIWANGTSFNVSPRPELPLTSSDFQFLNYARTQDILCVLFCLCSFYFGKWNLFQCLSKAWVTTDEHCFSFCGSYKDKIFYAFVLPMFLFITANGTSLNVFLRPEL